MTGTRSRLATVLVSTVCVTAVVLGLLTATSTLTPAVAFAQTGHGVVNTAERAVVHVDSGTAQVDARVELPADVGEPLFALQGDRQGFVVSRNRVAVFGRSTLTVDTTIPVEFDEVPVGIETVGGPYLVYPSAGTIVRLGVPPLSLPVGGPVERPVWTDDGTVWLHRPDNGSFCALRAGADALDCSAGAAPGEPGGLSITGDLPAFVGTRQDAAQIIEAALGAPVGLGADVAEAGLLADRDTEGRLAVVEPGANRLVLTDSGGVPTGRAGGAAISVDLGVGEFTSPIASRGVIAVLDVAANRLLTFDTAGRLLSTTDLPPGSPPRLTRGGDGTIYVDDASGASTHVVGVDGTVTSVATGGLPPASVAVAAPPERRSPVAPPPTFRGPTDLPTLPGTGNQPPTPGVLPINTGGGPQPTANPPDEPTGVAARLQADAVIVTWLPVDGAGRPVIYTVRANGGNPQTTAATTLTYVGLAPGQSFTFQVQATAGGMAGPESAPSNPITIPVAAPVPPGNLRAAIIGPFGEVTTWTASWTEPELGGAELVGYEVETGGTTQTVTGTSAQIQTPHCASHTVTVRTISRAPGGPVRAPSPPASLEFGQEQDCTLTPSFGFDESQPSDEEMFGILLTSAPLGTSAPCSMAFNGIVRWTGICSSRIGVYRDGVNLEPDTTYEVVLRIDAPTTGSRATTTGPITYRTGPAPASPNCSTDPLPAGC
jgi:hypothetical protein